LGGWGVEAKLVEEKDRGGCVMQEATETAERPAQ
jgi:hypothetical protein